MLGTGCGSTAGAGSSCSEQEPLLEAKGLAVAVATAIRGKARYRFARSVGAYAHSAAVPRAFRSDAVFATAELVTRLDTFWQEAEAAGSRDSVFTIGKFFTDPDLHAMTKVPGAVSFTLNFGTTRPSEIETFKSRVREITRDIEARRRVRFELGEAVGTDPLALNSTLRLDLTDACDALGHAVVDMATAGHDAAMFTSAGIPSGMILVRNACGSHNADESMDLDDFAEGCKILVAALAERGCQR